MPVPSRNARDGTAATKPSCLDGCGCCSGRPLFGRAAGYSTQDQTESLPKFDRLRGGVISWGRPGRGAEAMSSRADVPRSFGGPSERCSRNFRRSRRRQSRRGGWGAWLTLAHCHPADWDGALSRSKAPCVLLRPASFPARHSFLRITIGFSRTGFSLSGFNSSRVQWTETICRPGLAREKGRQAEARPTYHAPI